MLRICRRRTGLTQDEVAWLLGLGAGSAISRYENGTRAPDLVTAMACAIIFKVSVEDLFAEMHAETRHTMELRARALANKLKAGPVDARATFVIRHLESVPAGPEAQP